MNAVEIEEAVSLLAEAPFDPKAFPFAFLEAFGNKDTTLKRLRTGNNNPSDLPGAVLQRNNIHIWACPKGQVTESLAALRQSRATVRHKAKFILATDGESFEAENLVDGETVACAYADFHDHFGFFLPLAGITTVRQIRENAFDIKATGRLNRLYVELLRENPDWDTAARREDLNHFFARLIFCFFAEDTGIFIGDGLFTDTIQQMSARDSSNTHEVLSELFRAMNTKPDERESGNLRNWAKSFPYVNGGLFSGSMDVPRFSRIARSYLLHVGNLDWTKINPDIFGSMIQAVADDEERGALGLHYTSVPNILKVLNPLFLDELREKLEEAGNNARKLLNLRQRLARIRVFDPACGSGNFLVIAYKEMRAIEGEINRRRRESHLPTEIPLTNFRGIEIRHFSAEIARLALVIAEYQCDVLYRGEQLAKAEFLPLEAANWITCGNALRLDWLAICPPTGTGVKVRGDDLFNTPLVQTEIDFENEGGETYICGNPPYTGYNKQSPAHKEDLAAVFAGHLKLWGNLDYVTAWFYKAALFGRQVQSTAAFVATNTICQGGQVPVLWPALHQLGAHIAYAYTSFRWANLASHNASITVVVVAITRRAMASASLYQHSADGECSRRTVSKINGYLIPGEEVYVAPEAEPLSALPGMSFGNHPYYGEHLIMTAAEAASLKSVSPEASRFLRPYYGSTEVISASPRVCIWVEDEDADVAAQIDALAKRFSATREARAKKSSDATARSLADRPYRFRDRVQARRHFIAVPQTSSERRHYLPCDLMTAGPVVSFKCFALNDAAVWNIALLASRLHRVWIGTVCARLRTDPSYSITLGWNTFPVPALTEQNKADLTRCAEDILLAREAHFPATIADLYDPETMPTELRDAHERNDETLERIYIGRRFKNDTERLEKLFEMYTQMTASGASPKKPAARRKKASDA